MIKITRVIRLTEALVWPGFKTRANVNVWMSVLEQVEEKTDTQGNIYTVMYETLKP